FPRMSSTWSMEKSPATVMTTASSEMLATAEDEFRRRYRRSEQRGSGGLEVIDESRPGGESHGRKTMTKARILIVEDDASLAEVLDYNLTQEGFETQVAVDGQQGLREIRLRCPDLVILDLMLPMIEGLEVCRLLRADPA